MREQSNTADGYIPGLDDAGPEFESQDPEDHIVFDNPGVSSRTEQPAPLHTGHGQPMDFASRTAAEREPAMADSLADGVLDDEDPEIKPGVYLARFHSYETTHLPRRGATALKTRRTPTQPPRKVEEGKVVATFELFSDDGSSLGLYPDRFWTAQFNKGEPRGDSGDFLPPTGGYAMGQEIARVCRAEENPRPSRPMAALRRQKSIWVLVGGACREGAAEYSRVQAVLGGPDMTRDEAERIAAQ